MEWQNFESLNHANHSMELPKSYYLLSISTLIVSSTFCVSVQVCANKESMTTKTKEDICWHTIWPRQKIKGKKNFCVNPSFWPSLPNLYMLMLSVIILMISSCSHSQTEEPSTDRFYGLLNSSALKTMAEILSIFGQNLQHLKLL